MKFADASMRRIGRDTRNGALNRTVNGTDKKFVYWIKYAGIVDGAMGILTRKQYMDRPIEISGSSNKKLNLIQYNPLETSQVEATKDKTKLLSNMRKIPLGNISLIIPCNSLQKNTYSNNKSISEHKATECKSPKNIYTGTSISWNQMRKTSCTWDRLKKTHYFGKETTKNKREFSMNMNHRNFTSKDMALNELIRINSTESDNLDYLNKSLINATTNDISLYQSNEQELSSEQITGVPNPDKYNSHIITNYMHPKKLCKTQKPQCSKHSTCPEIIGKNILKGPKRVKFHSQLVFTNRRLKERLESHLWIPLPANLNDNDPHSLLTFKRNLIKRRVINSPNKRVNICNSPKQIKLKLSINTNNGLKKNKQIAEGNLNYKNEENSDEELLCNGFNLSEYN